jgi:hypothetical protein
VRKKDAHGTFLRAVGVDSCNSLTSLLKKGTGTSPHRLNHGNTVGSLGASPLFNRLLQLDRLDLRDEPARQAAVSNGITALSGLRRRMAAANRAATSTHRILLVAPPRRAVIARLLVKTSNEEKVQRRLEA